MNRVVLIIIDGCRPDGLRLARTDEINRIMAGGSSSMTARTVIPPLTLPAHFSIFNSLIPINHGVVTNTGGPRVSPSATSILELAHNNGRSTAAFYSWEHLRNLAPPGALDVSVLLSAQERLNRDMEIAQMAADYINRHQPDFCFVYLEGVDIAGHASGWMSEPYLKAVETADASVGLVRQAVESLEGGHLILHSDHGGSGRYHLDPTEENMTIPWMMAGPEVKKGYKIERKTTLLDTAPTAALLLGLPPCPGWQGEPVREALR